MLGYAADGRLKPRLTEQVLVRMTPKTFLLEKHKAAVLKTVAGLMQSQEDRRDGKT